MAAPAQSQDQAPADKRTAASADGSFEPGLTLEAVRRRMHDFAAERDWEQYHTPRNVLLALVGEVGELSEVFQWRGEVQTGLPGWSDADREQLADELSDVLLYLVRLAQQSRIDLSTAVLNKLAKNAAKYPADRVRGKSKKYNEYS